MKVFLAMILTVHGLIHVLGLVKAFDLADLPQLTEAISRPQGLLWLLAALLFAAAAGLALQGGAWWLAALPALLLSQIVIVLSWQDARVGSLANLLVLLLLVPAWASAQFRQQAETQLAALLPERLPPAAPIRAEQLASLPPIVATWLQRAGIVGRPEILTVHALQRGQMRSSPTGAWMPVTAEQYITTREPGFSWFARVRMLPGIELLGWDSYFQGKGQMRIRALGLFPVADASGPQTDQGSLLRYLGEMIWFPSAALSPRLRWEAIDDISARAIMSDGGNSVEAVFTFTPEGDLQRLEAMRYYQRPGGASLEPWLVQVEPDGYRSFEGIRIPARSRVTWKLKEGDFTWFQLEIRELHFNQAAGPQALASERKLSQRLLANS